MLLNLRNVIPSVNMKKNVAIRFIYYINNYLLSYNLIVGLFLLFKILSTIFGMNSNIELYRSDNPHFIIWLNLIACILCVIGLFMSFQSFDKIRLGNQICQTDLKNFRVTSILITISGLLLLFQLKDVQQNSLLTIKINSSSFLNISWYGMFLLLIGQFFHFLCKKKAEEFSTNA